MGKEYKITLDDDIQFCMELYGEDFVNLFDPEFRIPPYPGIDESYLREIDFPGKKQGYKLSKPSFPGHTKTLTAYTTVSSFLQDDYIGYVSHLEKQANKLFKNRTEKLIDPFKIYTFIQDHEEYQAFYNEGKKRIESEDASDVSILDSLYGGYNFAGYMAIALRFYVHIAKVIIERNDFQGTDLVEAKHQHILASIALVYIDALKDGIDQYEDYLRYLPVMYLLIEGAEELDGKASRLVETPDSFFIKKRSPKTIKGKSNTKKYHAVTYKIFLKCFLYLLTQKQSNLTASDIARYIQISFKGFDPVSDNTSPNTDTIALNGKLKNDLTKAQKSDYLLEYRQSYNRLINEVFKNLQRMLVTDNPQKLEELKELAKDIAKWKVLTP